MPILTTPIANRLADLKKELKLTLARHHRQPNDATIIAVSKTVSVELIQQAIEAEQYHFGENYLQEALPKIHTLDHPLLQWHFIGPIQANKTKEIASHFNWAHSLCRAKIAKRLNAQRPTHLPPLNVCIQVNIDEEPQKAGIFLTELTSLAALIASLPRLKLRGLMTIPTPRIDAQTQRKPYHALQNAFEQLKKQGFIIDTLSMGMSSDWQAAIAEGATFVRIGSAIFGERTI